jgi:predicted NUDIX family NTP pyrophosphohydrolase
MAKRSAGLLIYRRHESDYEVLLVHPGGPYWVKKDDGSWSIPKGLVNEHENELAAAIRETKEEIGADIAGSFVALGSYRQPGGKTVVAWAVEANVDAAAITSNSFSIEWPPHSGAMQAFPEVDRAGWFSLVDAETKILAGQRPMLADFAKHIARAEPEPT